jgi:maleylpyruvate isomerase
MDAALRELNGQIDFSTQRLIDEARTLTEDDVRAPSLLPGWSRARVLAHVARGADAMRTLLAGAQPGQDRSAHADRQTWEQATERAARMGPSDLAADLADSAMALRSVVVRLPAEAWRVPLRIPGLDPFPAAQVLTRRLTELELHHTDLGTGYGPADWPAAFADMELPEPMRSQRQDRLSYPAASPEAAPRVQPVSRPPAPWKPGQRLPGSWIGPGKASRELPAPLSTPTCSPSSWWNFGHTRVCPKFHNPGLAAAPVG